MYESKPGGGNDNRAHGNDPRPPFQRHVQQVEHSGDQMSGLDASCINVKREKDGVFKSPDDFSRMSPGEGAGMTDVRYGKRRMGIGIKRNPENVASGDVHERDNLLAKKKMFIAAVAKIYMEVRNAGTQLRAF